MPDVSVKTKKVSITSGTKLSGQGKNEKVNFYNENKFAGYNNQVFRIDFGVY